MDTPRPKDRLDCLDVARGGAAMLVLLEHGLHWSLPAYLAFSKENVVVGQAAILVFFMVSGFVVPLSLDGKQSVRTFWLRRCFRLFPVYWFSIILAAVALRAGQTAGVGAMLADTRTWLANAVLMQKPLGLPNIWGVFWSLHFELALYIACTVLFAAGLLKRIGVKTIAITVAGFTVAAALVPLVLNRPAGDGGLRMVLLACMFGYLCHRRVQGRVGRGGFAGLTAAMIAAPLIAEAVSYAVTPTAASATRMVRYAVIMGLAFGTFAWLIENRHKPMPRWLVFLGRRSYPVYLVHPFVLTWLAATAWPPALFVPVLVVATLALADLTHRLVERPGIALGRRLERRPEEEPALLKFPAPASVPLRKAA